MRRSRHRLAWLLVFVASFALPAAARAQTIPHDDFSTLRFSPAPGPGNYFAVDGGRVFGHLTGSAGLVLDYGYLAERLYSQSCDSVGNCMPTINSSGHSVGTNIVSDLAVAHVFGTFSLFDRVQIALVVPVALGVGDPLIQPGMGPQPTLAPGGTAVTLADPRLHVKVNIVDDPAGLRFAVVAYGTAPTAHLISPGHYLGDQTATFGGHLSLEFVSSGFHVAMNVGGVWRDRQQLYFARTDPQLTYAMALGYDVTPLIDVFAELSGASAFTGRPDANGLEGRVGARLRVDDVVFNVGIGPGLVSGVGVPLVRVLGGFMWAPITLDSDRDGVPDGSDACPAEAEDADGSDDSDGCPETDDDGDGIDDAHDRCPSEREDFDQHEDTDGCPDLDTDGDGVEDGYDSCPTAAEDMDGDRDEDGCPDDDIDRDHIPDAQDRCPDQPEDTDGFGDEDGCPEVDFDGDSLPDDGDQCPDRAEDVDGFEDDDGCPEEGHIVGPPGDRDADSVRDARDQCPDQPEDADGFEDADGCPEPDNDADGLPDTQDHCPGVAGAAADQGCPHLVDLDSAHGMITLVQPIQFAANRATILPESEPTLQALLVLLVQHSEITGLRIEGHTDTSAPAPRAMELTGQRADAVRDWLVDHYVDEGRLSAFGCGRLHPIGDNATTEGREANRRIALQIVAPPTAGLEVFGDCTVQP
jgi:OOP family OmpA-OmpF porin